jgi:hypothetical protein
MPSKMTRRAWATTLGAAPVALAQTAASPQSQPPQNAEQWLEAQRRQLRRQLDQLHQYKLEQAVEPSFRFEP